MKLEERMKKYEFLYRPFLLPLTPAIARIDGRAFHTFCRGLERPFDARFHKLMVKVTEYLVKESRAKIGYAQSDEISLLLFSDHFESKIYFDGNVNKIISTLAATASVAFHRFLPEYIPEKTKSFPTFDARVCNYPPDEVPNYFVWRELDAVRNSILAAAEYHLGHSAIQNLNTLQLQDELFTQKEINWNDFPWYQKRGTYVRQKRARKKFTADEMDSLPPRHEARKNPDLEMERNIVVIKEIPPMTEIINRERFLLYGETPVTEEMQK
jgi:tRNA(His) 5'-end guanylyltransferase